MDEINGPDAAEKTEHRRLKYQEGADYESAVNPPEQSQTRDENRQTRHQEENSEQAAQSKALEQSDAGELTFTAVVFREADEGMSDEAAGRHFDVEALPSVVFAEGNLFFTEQLADGGELLLAVHA